MVLGVLVLHERRATQPIMPLRLFADRRRSGAYAARAYLTGVALPMVLIGAGQGLALAPLTSFGIARVRAEDAGAASGLVNTAHQLGMALGLAVLVAASSGAADLATGVATALTWGSGLLALCLVVVLAVILPAQLRTRRDTDAVAAEAVAR